MLLAPIASTYATRVPYVTPDEFKRHPTGVDVKNLVPNGTAAQNDQALRDVLRRASSYADNLTEKILAATVDTQYGTYGVGPGGLIKVPLDNSPVVGVTALQIGAPGALADWPTDGCDLSGRILTVPVSYTGQVAAKVTYINGWANAQLTVQAYPGATSLQLNNALGIVPGMTLQLAGANGSESVTVDASFTPVTTLAATTVPLAAPVTGAYSGGYMVGDVATAMPQSIKLAVILLACAIIKTRGSEALVMASVGGDPDKAAEFEDGAEGEYGMAVDLLAQYRRVI